MLGTVSVLFAIGGVIYAVARGGFRYYDPVLVRIYQMGSLVSLFAAVFAILGIWRSSPLRWHALILSLGMLFLWLVWAAAE